MLANDEWKFDSIPEIMDGMNVYDYIDPDILVKLRELEREEEERLENEQNEMEQEVQSLWLILSPDASSWHTIATHLQQPFRLTEDEIKLLKELRNKDAITRLEHTLAKGSKSKPTQHQVARAGRVGQSFENC